MLNYSLIEKATVLANEYHEANHIYVNSGVIRKQVTDWYNHTDITDEVILASAVIGIGDYKRTSLNELEQLAESFFPTEPLELQCYHIGEIEDALEDLNWM